MKLFIKWLLELSILIEKNKLEQKRNGNELLVNQNILMKKK